MSSYRFCRTDDIGLLVDALNRCWAPYFPDEAPMTPAAFKRSIRDLQVWCSSCMVAFSGPDPIGVLIGAKRSSATLVHKIAVHPDHRRQGHGRHLLTSLSSKLAILGPPRMVAEIPGALTPACRLFDATGYTQEAILTDYVLQREDDAEVADRGPALSDQGNDERIGHRGPALSDQGNDERIGHRGPALSERGNPARVEGLVIPVTVDDLAANGLLEGAYPQTCWEHSVETLRARKEQIEGLAVASDERIEAYVLYVRPGEIVSVRTFIEDGGARLRHVLARLHGQGMTKFTFPKAHAAEMSPEVLEMLGFRPVGRHHLYATRARAN
jgi:GNAT superfamily N-acetyltransferase